MPITRRSAGTARGRGGPAKGQSTISFANRVTKSVPRDIKSLVTPTSAPKKIKIVERTKPAEIEPDEQEDQDVEEAVPTKSEAESRAEKLSDAQIGKYWRGVEKERKAPRVHQEGLSVHDKVLRYFDVSSQYGPCIGIDRTRRWLRAERLGLNPPIEVLSVLVKERERSSEGVESAQMDHILSSIAIGS